MLVVNEENEINETIKKMESVTIYENGSEKEIKNSKELERIKEKLLECFSFSRIMPAFGVSLHNLMVQDMKKDSWIKINFSSTQIINELPFEALLFRLDDCYGINLIRETNGKFEGRCIYVDFDEKTDLTKILD